MNCAISQNCIYNHLWRPEIPCLSTVVILSYKAVQTCKGVITGGASGPHGGPVLLTSTGSLWVKYCCQRGCSQDGAETGDHI